MREWAMVVEVPTAPPVAIAVDGGRAPSTAGAVAGPLGALLGDGPPPASLVVIVPADTGRERFATLTAAAETAGLPAPTWVPDAVARAGSVLAALQPDRPRMVVDVRGGDPEVWGVRPAAAAGRIGTVEAVDVAAPVAALLVETLRVKLAAAAPDRPELAAFLAPSDALHQDLRGATRQLADADDAEIVVDVEDTEVTVGSQELAGLVARAARDGVRDVLGPDAIGVVAVLVADAETGLVRHLAAAFGAMTVIPDRPSAALEGAAALARDRPSVPVQQQRTPEPVPAATPGSADRPRWAVPALSSLAVAALLGASGVLATGAMTPSVAPAAGPAVAGAPPAVSVAPVTAARMADPAASGVSR